MINSKTQDLYQYHANDGSAKTDEVQPSSKKIIKNVGKLLGGESKPKYDHTHWSNTYEGQ